MDTTAHPTGSGRGVLVGSLLFLGAATAVGFGRVFAGVAPSVRLAAAALVSTAIAALFARRHLALALVASAVVLLVTLGALVYPNTLWYGIPGPRTIEAIARSLERLGADAAREIAPAPPLPSLTTAALLAVWAATTAAHALAVRARSPVLAVVPGAVLVAFAGVVTAEPPRPLFAVLYLAGSFGVLFGASVDRLSTWAPIVEETGPHRLTGGTTGRWARRLAAVAAVIAVAMPGVLPGFGATPLATIDADEPSGVSINPIVDIRPSLLRQPAEELFVVEARRPAYWRLLSLDRFDGRMWTSSDVTADEGTVVGGNQMLGTTATTGPSLVQRFEIRSLAVPWLPAAYRATEVRFDVDGDGGAARWDADAAVLAVNDGTREGDTYTVRSQLVRPTARELDRAYAAGLETGLDRYLELPELPAELGPVLERITSGERTPYRQALAIQEHLRSFTYDVAAPAGHGTSDILFFLTQSQRGYCEQFAGAMAVLLRMLGIPARVAVGFAPGTRTDDGSWLVTTQDAHAWVEAYFPNNGWVAFEPTPIRTNPTAQAYLTPGVARPTGSLTAPREGVRSPATGGPNDRARRGRERTEGGDTLGPGGAPRDDGLRWPLWGVLAVATVAGLLALGIGRAGARRFALASARSPAERVVTAYRVFEASAADVGAGRRRGETLTEYGTRLERELPDSRDGAGRLATLSTAAAYSGHGARAAEADEAVALSRRLSRAVRRRAGLRRAALGAIRPAPPL